MATVVKEQSTLQVQAQNKWILVGVMWSITLITFFLPSLISGVTGIYLVALIMFMVASKVTWKSLIIIRGNIGEKRVFKVLQELPDSYFVLNDVTINVDNKEAQIDHLLISPFGVWSIETKSHLGRIYGKEFDKNWTQKKKSSKGRIYTSKFYNPVAQNEVHCKRLNVLINQRLGLNVPIKSVIVFTSASKLKVQSSTPVVKPKQLIKVIETSDMETVLKEETIKNIIELVS